MVLGDLFSLYSHATRAAYQRLTKEWCPNIFKLTSSATFNWCIKYVCSGPSFSVRPETKGGLLSVESRTEGLSCSHEESICSAKAKLRMRDFEEALSLLQAAHSDAIGAPKVSTKQN